MVVECHVMSGEHNGGNEQTPSNSFQSFHCRSTSVLLSSDTSLLYANQGLAALRCGDTVTSVVIISNRSDGTSNLPKLSCIESEIIVGSSYRDVAIHPARKLVEFQV
jgi:hypothetical protein